MTSISVVPYWCEGTNLATDPLVWASVSLPSSISWAVSVEGWYYGRLNKELRGTIREYQVPSYYDVGLKDYIGSDKVVPMIAHKSKHSLVPLLWPF